MNLKRGMGRTWTVALAIWVAFVLLVGLLNKDDLYHSCAPLLSHAPALGLLKDCHVGIGRAVDHELVRMRAAFALAPADLVIALAMAFAWIWRGFSPRD
jgi:hypothetical protein